LINKNNNSYHKLTRE